MVRLLENARYEVLPTASIEDTVLEHVGRDRGGHGHRLAEQGAGGHPRPHRAADRPRVHRRTPPRRADGARPRRAGGDLRPADRPGHRPRSSCPAATPTRPATTPTRCRCSRTCRRSAARSTHVGITGYPESHPTISDDLTIQSMWDKRRYATHVVSNLTFDPDVLADLGRRMRGAASPCRCCSASPARSTAPSCSRWPPRSASASRPGSWPSTRAPSPGWPHPAASPASGSSRRCAPALAAARPMLVEGLHVFTFNQVAATEAWRRELLDQLTANA